MIVDTGVLVAAADRGDRHHERCAELLGEAVDDLIVPVLAVAEVAHFLGRRMGAEQELAFLAAIEVGDLLVEPVEPEDWPRIAELVGRYADVGLRRSRLRRPSRRSPSSSGRARSRRRRTGSCWRDRSRR